MEPELDEVLQTEPDDAHIIPVKVCEPVETRELPTKRLAPRTVPITSTVAGKLLSADPRRKSALIVGRSSDILIGVTQAQANLTGTWYPGSVPYPTTTTGELWAKGDGANTDVSVIEEYWA
jgi:hypothetical protein